MWKLLFSLAATALALHSYAQGNPPIIDCFNAVRYDPSLNLIADKVGLGAHADRPFALMANESYPTESERKIILDWGGKRDRCLNTPPDQHAGFAVYLQAQRRLQMLVLDLYGGNMTYGNFVRQKEALNNAHQGNQDQISNQIQQQQAQQQQYQQQQQQYQQQQEEFQYQACMNRARDQLAQSACQMERGGRQLGGALFR